MALMESNMVVTMGIECVTYIDLIIGISRCVYRLILMRLQCRIDEVSGGRRTTKSCFYWNGVIPPYALLSKNRE